MHTDQQMKLIWPMYYVLAAFNEQVLSSNPLHAHIIHTIGMCKLYIVDSYMKMDFQ